MYSNNSGSLRDALCFLMDEEKGQRIAFVQFPQSFDNITKNDIYSGSLRVITEVSITKNTKTEIMLVCISTGIEHIG